jgi:hypothetical protein
MGVFLYKNINKITQELDNRGEVDRDKSIVSIYAKFAGEIIYEIKELKSKIDPQNEKREYELKEGADFEQISSKLSDFIRKLVFFESMMARDKSPKEIEADLFEILSALDDLIIEHVINGERLSDSIRERLFESYKQLKG